MKGDYKVEYYIYKFLGKDEIIYIGKTTNINQRMYSHFTKGHLPLECYERVEKIQYIECKNKTDMDLKELYFINKYKPIYNTAIKSENDYVTIKEFDNINWIKEFKINEHKNIIEQYEDIIYKLNIEKQELKKQNDDLIRCKSQLLDENARCEYLSNKYKEILDNIIDNKVKAEVKKVECNPYWKNSK